MAVEIHTTTPWMIATYEPVGGDFAAGLSVWDCRTDGVPPKRFLPLTGRAYISPDAVAMEKAPADTS